MPATKKAKTPPEPMIFVRATWVRDLKGLKVKKFFNVPSENLAKSLRQLISRLKKTNKEIAGKEFTVVKVEQRLKVGQVVKAPVYRCWRTK